MKSLKRTQHQKRQSKRKYQYQLSKQNGGNIESRVYSVYCNIIISNTPKLRAMEFSARLLFQRNTPKVFLTRRINEDERATLLNQIIDDRESVIEDHAPALSDVQVISLEQLTQPHNDKYFKLKLQITKDFSEHSAVEQYRNTDEKLII